MRLLFFWPQLATLAAALALRVTRGTPREGRLLLGLWVAGLAVSAPHVLLGFELGSSLPPLLVSLLGIALAGITALGCGWALVRIAGRLLEVLVGGALTDPSRRAWLTRAPALAVGGPGVAGLAEAALPPSAREIEVALPALDSRLEGLRILQISDLHLGPVLGIDWLVHTLGTLKALAPVDLVVVTGDFADDAALLPEALRLVEAVPAALGHFLIPGNHEHYGQWEAFLSHVAQSGVRRIDGEVVPLSHRGAPLQLLGIDYPWAQGIRRDVQHASMVEAVTRLAPPERGMRLLLAHHPAAFRAAAENGIELTLSGHTHGGQIAPLWRLFEFGLGHHSLGASRLYVTSGTGHWLPFRLGVPCELAVLVLRRGDGPTPS